MADSRRGPRTRGDKSRPGRGTQGRGTQGRGTQGRGTQGRGPGQSELRGKQRRAFTPAKTGGKIASGGDPRLARGLADALAAPKTDLDAAESLTHAFHAYPARMHPATARAIIEGLAPRSLFDPFCGSGTTLVEAIRVQAMAHGVDANPLAVQLATTKTWTPGRPSIRELSVIGRSIADVAMARVKEARRGKAARAAERQNRPRTRKGLAGWFAPHVLAELESVAALIREVGDDPDRNNGTELRRHLEMVLSSLLYKVSFRASDTDASRVTRQVPRGAVSRHFRQRVIDLSDALRGIAHCDAPVPSVVLGDARELDIKPQSIDLVLTSPPYPGTYDYVEHHQLRMDFLEIETETFTQRELGARRHFRGSNVAHSLESWRQDTVAILKRLREGLSEQGQMCFLVGDSLAGGTAIRADDEINRFANETGLTVLAWAWQTRRSLGGREREVFADLPKREHLILLG